MEQNKQKKIYQSPVIDVVSLDSEISLILVSNDPDEPMANNNGFYVSPYKNTVS